MPSPVRVRYAPSPTGDPHVGNIRQALFDWLLARSTGGAFVLRIEDTDRNRYVPSAVAAQLDALRWLGLDWDEGPDVGGPYAPYVQSQRLDLYHAAAHRLIESGHAYECYCSEERLDALRNEQRELRQPPGYDGRCRTDAGRAEAKAEAGGAPAVVRFKMPREGETVFHDYIRGDVTFKNALIDDFVILKSDGFPTYHLAQAVDDHEMKITHVIRNEEWLPSAPRHKLLFEALGHELPVFVHTASILGPDRSKLSKRHGAQSVLEYRDQGYLPQAVFNFLGLLGWSLDDHTEIISRDDFVKHFSLDRLLKSPAVFNLEKLDWMNGEYMRALADDEFVRLVVEWLEKPEDEGGLPPSVARPIGADYTRRMVPIVKERVKLLSKAREMMDFFYLPEPLDLDAGVLLGERFKDDRSQAALLVSEALVLAEQTGEWTAAPLEQAYRALAERLGARFRDLAGLMRAAITGRTVSPPLLESMDILGRERCLRRLRDALNLL